LCLTVKSFFDTFSVYLCIYHQLHLKHHLALSLSVSVSLYLSLTLRTFDNTIWWSYNHMKNNYLLGCPQSEAGKQVDAVLRRAALCMKKNLSLYGCLLEMCWKLKLSRNCTLGRRTLWPFLSKWSSLKWPEQSLLYLVGLKHSYRKLIRHFGTAEMIWSCLETLHI